MSNASIKPKIHTPNIKSSLNRSLDHRSILNRYRSILVILLGVRLFQQLAAVSLPVNLFKENQKLIQNGRISYKHYICHIKTH